MEAPQNPAGDAQQGTGASGRVVVGLVLTTEEDALSIESVEQALAGMPDVVVGEREGAWLPLTAEVADPMELHRRMEALPGVVMVDVAFVELADEGAGPAEGRAPGQQQ